MDDVEQALADAHNAGGEPAEDADVVLSRLDRLADLQRRRWIKWTPAPPSRR